MSHFVVLHQASSPTFIFSSVGSQKDHPLSLSESANVTLETAQVLTEVPPPPLPFLSIRSALSWQSFQLSFDWVVLGPLANLATRKLCGVCLCVFVHV